MKSNKSFISRVRVTKRGKILTRKKGHGHFNAKEKRSKQLAKKGTVELNLSPKSIQRFVTTIK